MRVSTYFANLLLNSLFRDGSFPAFDTLYFAPHSSDPGTTGTGEIAEDNDRFPLTDAEWNASSGGSITTASQIDVDNMPESTVTHFGIYDALTDGNYLFGGELAEAVAIAEGNTFTLEAGNLTATFS